MLVVALDVSMVGASKHVLFRMLVFRMLVLRRAEFFFGIYRLVEALVQELFGKRQKEEDADEDIGIKASQLRSFARHDSFITQKSFWERIDDVKGDTTGVSSVANADGEPTAVLRSSHQTKSHRRRFSWLSGDANFPGSTDLSHAHFDGYQPA